LTERLYNYVGTATTATGVIKMRYTDNLTRYTYTMEQRGDTDINMHELPHPMARDEALAWFKMQGHAPAGYILSEPDQYNGKPVNAPVNTNLVAEVREWIKTSYDIDIMEGKEEIS